MIGSIIHPSPLGISRVSERTDDHHPFGILPPRTWNWPMTRSFTNWKRSADCRNVPNFMGLALFLVAMLFVSGDCLGQTSVNATWSAGSHGQWFIDRGLFPWR
jgi:hypothetical protein